VQGHHAVAASPMSFSSGTIVGLTYVSAAGAAQFTAKSSAGAESGRNAELKAKGRHGGNSFRLEPGNCHQLSNLHVMTAYSKWAANQSTAKKAPFCFFLGAQESWRQLPLGMDMCWVLPSMRCCAESVRACLLGSTV